METYEQLRLNGFEQTESPGGGITVLSAGFPCQPYSLAGKGLGDGDSRDLWGEVARILREVRPKWFVGENTPGLFARSNQRFFRRVIDDITENGYSVSWSIWGACDVGAPHQRDRVFIVGRNADSDDETEKQEFSRGKNFEPSGDSGNFSHAAGKRRGENAIQRRKLEKSGNEKNGGRIQKSEVQSKRICSSFSGAIEWWQTEPAVGRVAYGISNRLDRLRCLGNAVVPYQALPIFEAIRKIEERGEEQ